jgi:hypothetical protein
LHHVGKGMTSRARRASCASSFTHLVHRFWCAASRSVVAVVRRGVDRDRGVEGLRKGLWCVAILPGAKSWC